MQMQHHIQSVTCEC